MGDDDADDDDRLLSAWINSACQYEHPSEVTAKDRAIGRLHGQMGSRALRVCKLGSRSRRVYITQPPIQELKVIARCCGGVNGTASRRIRDRNGTLESAR